MNNTTITYLLSEFSTVNPMNLTCVVDKNGIIRDSIFNSASNTALIMNPILRKGSSIEEYFDFPKDHHVTEYLQTTVPRIVRARPNIFQFHDEPEENYATIPTFYLKLVAVEEEKYYCLIFPSRYLTELLGITDRFGYFCVDDQDRLTAYNRHFAEMVIPESNDKMSILGKSIADYISPTPSQTQTNELKNLNTLSPGSTKPILEWNFSLSDATLSNLRQGRNSARIEQGLYWEPTAPTDGWLLLEKQFDWDEFDIRLDITITKGSLPCLIFGDSPRATSLFSDRNGYLLGPNFERDSIMLKRGGDTQAQYNVTQEIIAPGNFSFIKSGNCFLLYRDKSKVFGHYDNAILYRRVTNLMLFLREGENCTIDKMTLYLIRRKSPHTRKSVFVQSTITDVNFHLLTRIKRLYISIDKSYHTLYQMRNLTDLKKNMDELEESLKSKERTADRAQRLLKAFTNETSAFVGDSRIMRQIRENTEQIAASRATVLIEGETGTGKEVLARYLHAVSPRSGEPFIKVDCSTLPASLMESLLFGHEKGAFTGAIESRVGQFEQANRGTLFIDEAGNLPLDVQAKLLQFMQDQTLTPVGGRHSLKLDVRIVVASNIPLKTLVLKGLFREDLYYRIAVFDIHLPPLRERIEDLPVLTAFFLKELNTRFDKKISSLTPDTYQIMYRHKWPGNIRELKNALERAYLFCNTSEIEEITLQSTLFPTESVDMSPTGHRKPMRFLNKSLDEVTEIIKRNSGNIKASAKEMNVSMQVLYYFLNKHNIKPNDLRKNPRRNL